MIVPLVDEEEWKRYLSDLPIFEIETDRVLLVAPHPDDETLGAGGLIASLRGRHVEVVVIAVTDGENAYAETPGLAQIRRGEQESALRKLGVAGSSLHRLGLTDSGVGYQKEELAELLLPFITQNTHVLAPWTGDFHPDHEACGWAAQRAVAQARAKLSWYFFWTWHRGTPAHLHGMSLRSFPLTADLLAAKLEALSCHRSQLYRASNDPILPESLLAPARRDFEVFASA